MSFTAATMVLLASGKTIPISKIKPGDKVPATDTRTGKTKTEPASAVLVHYDTDLFDLIVRSGDRTAVIHTTRDHLFWDTTAHRWVKAAALGYG
jgi:Pretoxin HINT domain